MPKVAAPATQVIVCAFASATAGGGADFSKPGVTVQPAAKPPGRIPRAGNGATVTDHDHPEWGKGAFAEVQTSTGDSGVLPAGTRHIDLFLPSFHVVAIVPGDSAKDAVEVADALGEAASH